MVLLVHRHCVRDVEETNHAWTKCLNVLASYETGSRTALRCLKLLQLSDSCFLARNPPSTSERATERSRQDAAPRPNNQAWPESSNSYYPRAMGENFGMSDHRESFPGQEDGFAASWMNDQIDLAWLSAVPFELGPDDWIDMSL